MKIVSRPTVRGISKVGMKSKGDYDRMTNIKAVQPKLLSNSLKSDDPLKTLLAENAALKAQIARLKNELAAKKEVVETVNSVYTDGIGK